MLIGSLVVPLASNWPYTITVAFVFISICVPGSIVSTTLFVTTTVPIIRFVPDNVVFVVRMPETVLVCALPLHVHSTQNSPVSALMLDFMRAADLVTLIDFNPSPFSRTHVRKY